MTKVETLMTEVETFLATLPEREQRVVLSVAMLLTTLVRADIEGEKKKEAMLPLAVLMTEAHISPGVVIDLLIAAVEDSGKEVPQLFLDLRAKYQK